MDLNKLRTFTVVAKYGSVSKAAESLYRTQPAISNQLKDLEQELRIKLFERKHARVYLTHEGEALYKQASSILSELDDVVVRLRDDRLHTEGLIKIAVEHDTVSYLLPTLLAQFKVNFPRVCFEIIPSSYGKIDELLLHNEVDFAMVVAFTKKEFFETRPFFTFTRSLVATKEYLAKTPPINEIEDLLNHNFIGFYNRLGDMRFWLKKNGFSNYISLFEKCALTNVVHDASTLNEMIFSGVGLGFTFDHMAVQQGAKANELVTLFPKAEPMYVSVEIAQKKSRNACYVNDAFFEFVMEYSEKNSLNKYLEQILQPL